MALGSQDHGDPLTWVWLLADLLVQNIGLASSQRHRLRPQIPVTLGHVEGTAYNYTLPMVIFASCGIAAMLLGLWLKAEDRKKNYGLELPNIKK